MTTTTTTLVIKKNPQINNPELVPEATTKYFYTETNEELLKHLQQTIITHNNTLFEKIILVEIIPNDEVQGLLFKFLQSKGKLMIDGIPDRESGQTLAVDLKIQGFLDIMAVKDPSTGRRFLVCQKPEVDLGNTAKIQLTASVPAAAPAPAAAAAAATAVVEETNQKWKVSVADLTEEEFIDENTLLEESQLPASNPTQGENEADCGTGKNGAKRACKNCTCGLKDGETTEANVPKTVEEKVEKASSCGNCYKGDAYRCASCPFLGKPAFEPGQERVILAMGNDDI